mmetsp:Transcript_29590/g.47073  ORF Transcript_29590/g.47073 Transcript_29590/m.47073 type:complete len:776 (+) Transcript_29590:85-2412(+)
MSKAYLLFYNLASAIGWALVLFLIIQSLQSGDSGKELWQRLSTTLIIVQSAAFMEILHSALGMVRSPIVPVVMQVGSRLAVVYMYMIPSSASNGHWSLYLCTTAWALVEIPRYLFYAVALNYKDEPHKINSILFFLRYHLFIVLYPSGITGELLQMYNAYAAGFQLVNNTSFFLRVVTLHHLVYIPAAPFMIFNMWINKKRAYKKRKQSANPRPLDGLIWPITDKKTATRSTTRTNKAIWAASIASVDSTASKKCEKERNWRFGYGRHVMSNVELSCQSKQNALAIAQAGLDRAYELFEFKRGDQILPFKQAMSKGTFSKNVYTTHVIKGDQRLSTELTVEYGGGQYQGAPYYLGLHDKTVLSGKALHDQLDKWVEYGTIEPSAQQAIKMVDQNKQQWLDLSDRYFVLLGATSAMGPLFFLLEHGANIIAVDLDRDFIWNKLFKAVRNSGGTLIFPVKTAELDKAGGDASKLSDAELAKISGSNLLADTPEIVNWLETVQPNKEITIGNYTYLDGALHVQLSLACDSIISRLCQQRKANQVNIAFLCTPTDNHVLPEEAYTAARDNYTSGQFPSWVSMLNSLFCGKLVGEPNYKGMKAVKCKDEKLYIVDGIAVAQGPNYALAKRMQHWRAVLAYHEGHIVSSNVAPSTATESVVHNAQFAAAYGGMHLFKPMEVMYQRTSLKVMGTLLIHDVSNKQAASNPNSKLSKSLVNPFQLFSFGSFHGGVWRCSFKIDKIGVPSALSFYLKTYKFPVIAGTATFAVITNWLLTGHAMPF